MKTIRKRFKRIFFHKKGSGLLEVILAMGVFAIVASAGVSSVLFMNKSNRVGSEDAKANLLLQEGYEAVRAIKKGDWSNLVNGTYGLSSTSGKWAFSGNSDVTDGYTRVVTISNAQRDASGNLVASGGTVDENTKKITETVTWQYTPESQKTVDNVFYVSNWERSIGSAFDGMLVYADYSGSDDVIKYRLLSNGTWGEEQTVPDFNVPANRNTRRVELYDNPNSDEMVLLTKHTEDGQFLYAQVWDGTAWGNVIQLTGYGDNTNPETRNFDGGYLTNGDFMVVYDDFTWTPKYRTWDGTSWSSEHSTRNVGGWPVWIVFRARTDQDGGTMVVRDAWQHTNTSYWDGSSWTDPVEHGWYSTGFSRETIDYSWSYQSPELGSIMYNEWYDTRPNVKVFNGNNESWTGSAENKSVSDIARIMRIIAIPNEDKFLGCVKDSGYDVTCFTTQTNPSWHVPNNNVIASNTDHGDQRSFDIAFERNGNLGLAVYSNGSDSYARRIPKYRTFDIVGDAFSSEHSLSPLGGSSSYALETVRAIEDPSSSDIMVLFGDSDQDLNTILWDGDSHSFVTSGDMGMVKQAQFGSNDLDYWYDFAWNK